MKYAPIFVLFLITVFHISCGQNRTAGGISRYDPSATLRTGSKSFQKFTTADGLSNNDLHAILEDKTGKIWFGSRGDISVVV